MNNTKKIKLALLATACPLFLAGTALAEEAKPKADLTTGLYSQYIWRGFAYSRDSLVIQPSMTVAHKGFAVNLWGTLDTNQYMVGPDDSETSNFNETDLTMSYSGSSGKLGYSGGYILYSVEGLKDTQEVYGTIGVDTLLAPNLTVYKEITGLQGWYAKAAVSQTLELTKALKLALGASVGYLDDEADYSELHDGVLSASLAIPVAEYLTVSPQIYYSFPLSSKAKNFLKNANKGVIDKAKADFVYGGLTVNLAF